MPPRAPLSRNENLGPFGDVVDGLACRRAPRYRQTSRFAMEKPLLSRGSQGVKFKDKMAKVESSIRPPHSDLPLEFVRNANNVFVVQQKPQVRKGASKEEELVKYMSKVPGYLQHGEKLQDNNALNFGVLDWGRLEKWTHKREKSIVSEGNTRMATGSSSSGTTKAEALAHSREKPSNTNSHTVHKVDFSPVVKPLSGKALNCTGVQTSSNKFIYDNHVTCKKDTQQRRDAVNFKYANCKNLGGDSSVLAGRSSSSQTDNCDHEVLETVNRKLSISDGEALKCHENIERLGLDTPHQYCSGKQESIVLLLPKDFSVSGNREVHHRASLDGKSAELNWGSFSDIFSIDEIHADESDAGIPHSCPLNVAETEMDLDLKLDTLIKAQGIEIPEIPSDLLLQSTESNIEAATSTTFPNSSSGPHADARRPSAEMSGDIFRHRQFGFGLARMTKSLSFRESSAQPALSSTCVTAKSGPAKSAYSESRNSNKAVVNGRARASRLRRLLDPLLKSKVINQLAEQSNDFKMKPAIPIHVHEDEKDKSSTVKALLHLTIKSGPPLFKFVVELSKEIFASTVTSLSTLRKDDISWLYTFYSVHKVRKRSGSWKNQKVKPCGFGYNVVGQMKDSKPRYPSWWEQNFKKGHMVKESVLYDVDTSRADAATSESTKSRELAAIIVNVPESVGKSSSFYSEYKVDDCFSNFEDENLSDVIVILPGGEHTLPHEGVPSSLINRWRSGGSCDCGGWDVGCKLRILTDRRQHKLPQVQCDLYDQGEAKQGRPFFSLIPLEDGLFSVEFDAKISSLQAFSMAVALINSRNQVHSTGATGQAESKQSFCRAKASIAKKSEVHEKHASHLPLSPVERV